MLYRKKINRHVGAPLIAPCLLAGFAAKSEANQKPNILLVMCDDLGFSDIGSFGGEIQTPNIDALAKDGLRFVNIKNTSRCCPSRASLMTGRYQHSAGMGWMTAVDEHRQGYRGQLSNKIPTIAEILKPYGYQSYFTGKWHLSLDGSIKKYSKPNGSWPGQRGFDRSFGIIAGGGGFYKPVRLFEELKYIRKIPKGFYLTNAISRKAVQYINEHPADKPMFMYIAHYAPHRPLEAPEERVEKCRQRYKAGYDELQKARFERLKSLGIIPPKEKKLPLHSYDYEKGGRPKWDELDETTRKRWIKEMATYAAMVEIVDDGIGDILHALKERKMYDNTVIMFLSDNGATREGGRISQYAADVSNTPYRNYKAQVFHGGISTPFILHCPKQFGAFNGEIRRQFGHIIDICPTVLDLADVPYPKTFRDIPIPPSDGKSLLPAVKNSDLGSRDLFFEHQSSCAVISGNWKLVRKNKNSKWQLFDLKKDPFEQKDVSLQNLKQVKILEKKWNAWAGSNNVLPFPKKLKWHERIKYYSRKHPDQDGID